VIGASVGVVRESEYVVTVIVFPPDVTTFKLAATADMAVRRTWLIVLATD